ncbi:hypothetical protein BpHYR1_016945 [Brachionus plicatilis]|uniref:Uncharacterized protein n=1 Tax=Brachionus plicatilis TaxID=10195 RepID=A0A3M7SSF1_BRAPC|nr:hypothetical protein BpHYR1_016945 [Brachionus plicatilis]
MGSAHVPSTAIFQKYLKFGFSPPTTNVYKHDASSNLRSPFGSSAFHEGEDQSPVALNCFP